ncbi:ArnT family glycosyltransferase [Fontivita pretiosa]|uniref:ArnT family glycosyltransferase n=1 Tax=Fontivita pretiosa TaxID=2989684 RepID=UPI003D162CBF
MSLNDAPRPTASIRRIDLWVAGIVMSALLLRLGWVIRLPADLAFVQRLPDQLEYLELGRNLRAGQGLHFVDTRFSDVVYAYRMPLYPALIAACGAHVQTVRIVQCFIDASNVLAAYLLGRRLVSRSVGLYAAAILTVNPFLIYFCGLILSETLFAAMLIWGMVLLISQPAGSRSLPRALLAWCAGVLMLALSVLVRPSALLLPTILSIAAAFLNRHQRQPYDWRWFPPAGSFSLLLTGLVLLPWAWRNRLVLDAWVWTTTNSGITLYDGLNPDATGASDQRFIRNMPQLKTMDEVGRSRYLTDLAMQFVREHPRRAIELAGIKIARLWSPIPLSNQFGNDWRVLAVAAGYMLPMYLLTLLGLWLWPMPRSAKLLLLLPAAYFTMAHALTIGSLRYRLPADVPMAILAGAGLQIVRDLAIRRLPVAGSPKPSHRSAPGDAKVGDNS